MESVHEALLRTKRDFGNAYGVDIPKIDGTIVSCVFRPLSLKEFREISAMAQVPTISDEIISRAVVYPETSTLQDVTPGVYESLATCIVEASGFMSKDAFESAIGPARMKAMEIYSQMALFICKAFPAYKLDEIENLNHTKQMEMVASAEMVMGIQFPWNEFFSPKKKHKEPTSDVPKGDFSHLPAYTPEQLEAMTQGALRTQMTEKITERRLSKEERRDLLLNKKDSIARQKVLKEWGD